MMQMGCADQPEGRDIVMAQVILPNSTYLDYTSYGTTTATTVADAYGFDSNFATADTPINVALMLPRANDPTTLLESDWATRQKTLQALNEAGTLWSTYGADPSAFNGAVADLQAMGIPVLGLSGTDGYVSSAESRTIWLQLTPQKFEELFGLPALRSTASNTEGQIFWNGSLSLPAEIGATGVWFDLAPVWGQYPAFSDMSEGAEFTPEPGFQSIGNALSSPGYQGGGKVPANFANNIAQWFYNTPAIPQEVTTATIGLIEPLVGDALPNNDPDTFQGLLDQYRQAAGIASNGSYYVNNAGGQSYSARYSNPLERSLDIGVVASAAPQSTIGLYAGSGLSNYAHSSSFTAFQAAFWDQVNNPSIVSSSFSIFQQSKRGSPFANAVDELFVDAALRNIAVAFAGNDWGSSWNFANGLANVATNSSSPYALIVGGTSLTTFAAAPFDPTVSQIPSTATSLYEQALAGDRNLLWRLIAGGLAILPSSVSDQHAAGIGLVESVWNMLHASSGAGGISVLPEPGQNIIGGDGGVDTDRPVPWYQSAFGLTPTTVNPGGGVGRGTPDVSALSGGNMFYKGPAPNMRGVGSYYGTSAAAPLWASLLAQFDAIFADQGLPNLGFSNDLLYQAAAVAPAAFNDITYGNNTSSFLASTPVTLTGFGYEAGPGYDLATGLGTPNGLLLARALTAIAHAQMSSAAPAVLDPTFTASSVAQHLLVQPTVRSNQDFALSVAGASTSYSAAATSSFAWDSAFAQRAMQANFDPALVRLFDGASQRIPYDLSVADETSLGVAFGGGPAATPQAAMTNPFGFVDYQDPAGDGGVRLARAVAVAQTAGGADGQQAVVRLRQNTEDTVTASFYRVDDLNGTIDGLAPGQTGYDTAVNGRLYATENGTIAISGPGYGYYKQLQLTGIDGDDLVAMRLTSNGHDFYGFSAANESVNGSGVTHLWNYGLNTWGWESTFGGGDHDYNDLVVQLDFTSASGSGWLAQDASTGGDGDDVMYGNDEAGSMVGGLGDDLVFGQGGDDYLDGGEGNDTVSGGPGDDTIVNSPGNDILLGGRTPTGATGTDTLVFNSRLADTSVSRDGAYTLIVGPEGADRVTGFERYLFTDATVVTADRAPLVDDLFYLANYKDVLAAGQDADTHYAAYGWKEGRDPNPLFSTIGYLAANPSVSASNQNPLEQYGQAGWKEGRDPSAAFDNELYLARNPDVKAAGIDPLRHYIEYGQGEGREIYAAIGKTADLAVHPGFDAEFYLLSYADIAIAATKSGKDPFAYAYEHFEAYGWKEGRNPNAVFDTGGYLAAYGDVKAAGIDPLMHYDQYGWTEGRDPSKGFDSTAYLAAYGDVAQAKTNPMQHYLQYGAIEGRERFGDATFGVGNQG